MPFPTTALRAHRLWRTLVFSSTALIVSACTDSPSSVAPGGPELSSAATCQDTAPIQTLIDALLVDGGLRTGATAQFRNIARQYCAGATDDARAKVYALVEFAITRYNNGQVFQPGTLQTATTLFELISRLYQFVGLDITTSGITADDLQRAAWDGAVGIAQPGSPFTIKASSGDFASTTDAAFFVKPAIVVVSREPDAYPFQLPGVYTNYQVSYREYPPRYKIFTLPKAAQANYGHPVTSSSPKAYTAICPGDPHPAVGSSLRLLRVRDPNDGLARPTEVLPLSTTALALLNCTPKADSPPQVGAIGSASGNGLQQLARAGRVAAERIAGTIDGFFALRPLYAWDGGVGGNSFEYSGFVPVDSCVASPGRSDSYELTPLPTSLEATVRSLNSNSPVNVQFTNATCAAVRVYWLDFDGKRVFYQQLAEHSSYVQGTYLTHPWVITDLRGNALMVFQPQPYEGSMEAYISPLNIFPSQLPPQ